ncbi:hypothetical protein [Brevundimonas subvibrioides]|uniref:hypothetical protein n=1 Tax=Brevundimonas subvibrioides TaxID=74313 RepID=UPI0032D5842E
MFSHLLPKQPGTEPLAQAFHACRLHLIWALVFSALVNVLYLVPTLYMMQVYDRVVPTGGLLTLLLITLVAVFALATLAALDWLRARLLLRAGLRLDRLLAPVVLARMVDVQGRAAASQPMRDFDNVRAAVSGPGVMALFDAPWTPLYLACCFLLHPAIGVLTLVGGAVLIALAILNERDSRPRLRRAIQSTNAAYAAQEGIIGQSEVVRALGMRQASIKRQIADRAGGVTQYADAQLSGGRYSSAIKFLRLVMQSASLGLAAYLAVKGQISPGSIIAASVLLSRAVAPIELLVGAWPSSESGAGELESPGGFVRVDGRRGSAAYHASGSGWKAGCRRCDRATAGHDHAATTPRVAVAESRADFGDHRTEWIRQDDAGARDRRGPGPLVRLRPSGWCGIRGQNVR